jgi:Cdc6-like AAA superfamily ATPase
MPGLSPINRSLNLIPKRAEARQADRLRDTFEDSGVAAALEAVDHQVLYGRRGTGKTHALRYLETTVRELGDIAVYIDLRTVGSPDGSLRRGGHCRH